MLQVANLVNKRQTMILFQFQVKVQQYGLRRDESQTTDEHGNFLLFRCDC